jgi:hypothetical protein
MADPRAKSFADMLALTLANHRQPTPFSIQLMLAIFWEESLFKNVRQLDGGRGIGFGQVERQNLFFLGPTQPLAQKHGYVVPGVNTSTTEVSDPISVQISSCFLLHLFHHPTNKAADKLGAALQGYAGVRASAGTPLTPAQRQAIIQGWRTCELQLTMFPLMTGTIQVTPDTFVPELEDQLMKCLQKSRAFDPSAPDALGGGPDQTVRQRLFPPLWHAPLVAKQLPAFMGVGVQLIKGTTGPMVTVLQNLLNTKDVPDFMLATDAIFGPQTQTAVQAFQGSRGLKADGIVGPLTKNALVKT